MTLPPKFLGAARSEVKETFTWYEQQREGLGYRFLAALSAGIERARCFPGAFPRVGLETRKCVLRRFPYSFTFVVESDCPLITAVMHSRRRPEAWSDRVREAAPCYAAAC